MTVSVTNAQRQAPVNPARIASLARCALKRLRVGRRGVLAITFIAGGRMRGLNRRFLRRDRPTDVLSFRYDGEPVLGEILIAPSQARAYATRHGVPYEAELARYVIHGLLHWVGDEDGTVRQQERMRRAEDWLLAACARKAGPLLFSCSPSRGK